MAHFNRLMAMGGRVIDFVVPSPNNAAANQGHGAEAILGGLLLRDPSGAPRTDTLPTAPQIIAALTIAGRAPVVGNGFEFTVKNTSAGAFTLTLNSAGGATLVGGPVTIAQNQSRRFLAVITGPATVDYHSLGLLT